MIIIQKKYSDNYSKKSGVLWQYCRDKLAFANENKIAGFTEANSITNSFKIKEKIPRKTDNNRTKKVKIMVPLKYLSNFWRTLEVYLIN